MSVNHPQESTIRARLFEVRRRRLRELLKSYDTMTQFAVLVGEPLSYITRLVQTQKKGRKNLGDPKARKFELRLGLDTGWFDQDEPVKSLPPQAAAPTYWPFPFKPERFERLPASEKRRIAALAYDLIRAYESQEDEKQTG